jgi:thymidylate synthase (FAD)
MKFYSPNSFRTQHKSNRQASNNDLVDPNIDLSTLSASAAVAAHNRSSLYLYNSLIKSGVCREQARGVLPQNLYTEYYGTCNLGNLLKFINLRIHEGAQWEIQQVAKACLEIAEDLFPVTVKSYINLVSD